MPPFGAIKTLQKRTDKTFAECKAALAAHDGDEDAAAAALLGDAAPVPAPASCCGGVDSGVTVTRTEPGDGLTFPRAGDRLAIHYRGMLADGREFDSSYKRGKEFEFVLGRGEVIGGWDEGLTHLSLGEKATLVCAPDMAYGSEGMGGVIPPNATLSFDVHVVRIERAGEASEGGGRPAKPTRDDYQRVAAQMLGM